VIEAINPAFGSLKIPTTMEVITAKIISDKGATEPKCAVAKPTLRTMISPKSRSMPF
jgi:hypothetical protein